MAPLLALAIQTLIPVAVKEVEKRYLTADTYSTPTQTEIAIEAVKDTAIGSLKSKTSWASLGIGILGVLEAHQGLLTDYVGQGNMGYVIAGIAALTYFLRTITTTSIVDK